MFNMTGYNTWIQHDIQVSPILEKNDKDCVIVIFSKNRALQCDLCLQSFYLHCLDWQDRAKIQVLYTCDAKHEDSYTILMKEHASKNVQFVREFKFKEDLLTIMSNKKYVCFITDDSLFTRDFTFIECIDCIEYCKETIGISLRLGTTLNYCYTQDKLMNSPVFYNTSYRNIFLYDWTLSEFDYGYPLELSSSFYKVNIIHNMLVQLPYNNPNELEARLYNNSPLFIFGKKMLLTYDKPRCFSNPLNKVQSIAWLNRSSNIEKYSPDNMMEEYMKGLRISPEQFNKYANKACHEVVELF